jgi:uncharacterized protein (DUF58 family)
MKIPRSSISTTWKGDWLLELVLILGALGALVRELVLVLVAAGVFCTLVWFGYQFHHTLLSLRKDLRVEHYLAKHRISLIDRPELELSITSGSRFPANIISAETLAKWAEVQRADARVGLKFDLEAPLNRLLLPGASTVATFLITPLARGRFELSAFKLRFAGLRGLFTGEVSYSQTCSIEVYPGAAGEAEPLTPLALYGGRARSLQHLSRGEDYAGIRKYVSGDEYHRIEWKATARLRTLMIKEFHPEREATLHILIDAGESMQQRSYVGTRLDEALAVSQLLIQSASESTHPLGVWVYDEKALIRTLEPSLPEKQLGMLREFSLTLRGSARGESAGSTTNVALPRASASDRHAFLGDGRVVAFMRQLRTTLRSSYQGTGVYRAVEEATRTGRENLLVVLTDLHTNVDALAETAASKREAGVKTVVAQIGAGWRLSTSLEDAFAQYEANTRTLQRLQQLGLTVFDVRPEQLISAVSQHLAKTLMTQQVQK